MIGLTCHIFSGRKHVLRGTRAGNYKLGEKHSEPCTDILPVQVIVQ